MCTPRTTLDLGDAVPLDLIVVVVVRHGDVLPAMTRRPAPEGGRRGGRQGVAHDVVLVDEPVVLGLRRALRKVELVLAHRRVLSCPVRSVAVPMRGLYGMVEADRKPARDARPVRW